MINVNKLFRRLSIRAKLVIAFMLLAVVPLLSAGGYGAFFSFSLLSERLLDQVKFSVTTKAGEIQSSLSSVKEDVLFLSRLPTFQRLIDLPDRPNAALQGLVEQLGGEFLAFSRAHKAYYQVRYIDQRGMEVVRADFDGKQSYLLPREQLQDKADRYYFREVIQISPGEVYVSPMDLNIEKGAVEIPYKPVVRYATPVINSRGVRKGIVIINIYASYVLGQVLALRRDEGGIVFLTDKRGFYLSHSEKAKAGGDYFNLTADDNLKNDFPQLMVDEILSGKPGALIGRGVSGKIVAFAPIFPYASNPKEFWLVAQAYSKAELLSSIRSFQLLIFILGSLVLAIAVTAGIAAARHFTKPILELSRGAEIVAGGNFDHPIKVETNDEIEDLAYSFNLMTKKLKEHERQLQDAHERLEMKAGEAAALQERDRISKDLHDGIIQSIYATGLALEDGIHLVDEDPAQAKQKLERAIEDLNEVIKDVRNYIFNLQPEVLHGKDFRQALADLVKGLRINSLVETELVVSHGIDAILSQEEKIHLFNIVREALANVAKHARASRARVELSHAANGLILSIEDNGVGLNSEGARTGGQGLTNIAKRAKLLGGELAIESSVGRGTRLVMKIQPGASPGNKG